MVWEEIMSHLCQTYLDLLIFQALHSTWKSVSRIGLKLISATEANGAQALLAWD